jgi:tRNA modification GTPase
LTDDLRTSNEPVAALWTPRGRGAVATIRVRFDAADWGGLQTLRFRSANGLVLGSAPAGRSAFGWWGDDPAEQVVTCVPESGTLEIHCHGGDAAARRILEDLECSGCRVVTWSEMVREAEGPLEAELAEELSRATTLRTAGLLLEQSGGLLREALDVILGAPLDRETVIVRIDALLRWERLGLHLTRPWKVVLTGRPNVGKSSLINALVGYARSIVFEHPGTTRDVVTAATAVEGWPIELSDTAGIRASADPLEAAGVERARKSVADADLVLLLLDRSVSPNDEDRKFLAELKDVLVVDHKCDLKPYPGAGQFEPAVRGQPLAVSSKTGAGVNELVKTIASRLVPEVPPGGTPLPVTPRQTELLRQARAAAEAGNLDACRQAIHRIVDFGPQNSWGSLPPLSHRERGRG